MFILLALSANLTFALSSTIFTEFSREVSGKWINCFKLLVAVAAFSVAQIVLRDPIHLKTAPYFLISGALGLFFADYFLCCAFARLGPARTLMLFSFSPLFVAGWSFIFFGEHLVAAKFYCHSFFYSLCLHVELRKIPDRRSLGRIRTIAST